MGRLKNQGQGAGQCFREVEELLSNYESKTAFSLYLVEKLSLQSCSPMT